MKDSRVRLSDSQQSWMRCSFYGVGPLPVRVKRLIQSLSDPPFLEVPEHTVGGCPASTLKSDTNSTPTTHSHAREQVECEEIRGNGSSEIQEIRNLVRNTGSH